MAHVYTGSGSHLRSFRLWSSSENFAALCGPGYPAACGDTYWCLQVHEPGAYQMERIFQISLGNGVAVAPASVGRIKTLYR
ncbi:MAG TPA: hypothetical protein VMW93_09230, partial [bacterium]|nr:hypothetical protein [bacterium]